MALNVLYTAHAKVTGGRNGYTQTKDDQVLHDLSVSKATGGPGKPGTTTPEGLFAVGYAACFGSACDFIVKSMFKLNPSNIEIHRDAGIGTREEGGFGLKVGLTAWISGLSQADAEKLMVQAHQVCSYSNATRNNAEVTLKTEVI